MLKKVGPRLHDFQSWVPLASRTSYRNLCPVFLITSMVFLILYYLGLEYRGRYSAEHIFFLRGCIIAWFPTAGFLCYCVSFTQPLREKNVFGFQNKAEHIFIPVCRTFLPPNKVKGIRWDPA